VTTRHRLLAIDDSATLRKLLEIAFAGQPVELEFADTGAAGQLEAESNPPDLILLDFILPDMRAPQFTAWCAKHPKLAKVPLLIMSAKGDDIRALFMGEPMVIDFVPKPFTAKQIVSHVFNILDRRMRGEELGPLSRKRVRRVSLQQKQVIAQAIYARMRPQLARLPSFVEQLGDNDPAPFLARKLLTPPVVDELLDVLSPLLVEPLESKGTSSPLFQGHLGDLPLLSLLSMLTGEERSGILSLTDDADQRLQLQLQWGEILCVTCYDPRAYVRGAGVELPPVPAALWAHCEAEQRASATPVYVTLNEAGMLRNLDLCDLLARQGKRLLLEAVAAGSLRFAGRDGTPLPSYAIQHGRPLFLGQLALEIARDEAQAPAAEQRVLAADTRFVRCPEFSKHVRRFDLDDAERCLLALADGQTPAREIAQRARLELGDAVRGLLRLARAGLLREQAADADADRLVLIADPEFSAFRDELQRALSRRNQPVNWRELSSGEDVCAAVEHTKPRLLVINASLLPEQAFKVAESRQTRPGGQSLAMVAIVDGPEAELAQKLVSVGFDSVLMKPMLASDLERLLVA
jgi:DNA-binding response OmpR family regulator